MSDKNKKKIVKKSIDIEKESLGASVAPAGKKEKKMDLTQEIKKFLSEPITLEGIKRILLRLRGPVSENELSKSNIKIYGLPDKHHGQNVVSEFLIVINSHKFGYKYFLGHSLFVSLGFFNTEKLDNSYLKKDLGYALRNWFDKNLNQVTII